MSGRWTVLLVTVAGLAVPGPGHAETVLIAMRKDARPFVWEDPADPGNFHGYIHDLCVEATIRAGFRSLAFVGIGADERERVLAGAFEAPAPHEGETIDLLCDPTTITVERLETLVEKERYQAGFTPIIFVANGTFVRHSDVADRTACVLSPSSDSEVTRESRPSCGLKAVGDDGSRYALDGKPVTCLPEDGNPMTSYHLAGGVTGTTAIPTLEEAVRADATLVQKNFYLARGEKICLHPQQDHRSGVEAFCKKELHYYFGDLDIISAYRAEAEADGLSCPAVAGRALSYEPYALLVTSEKAGFRAKLIEAVYSIFSDETASKRFAAHFPDYRQSAALEMLYRLNQIPDRRPDEETAPATESAPSAEGARVSAAPTE